MTSPVLRQMRKEETDEAIALAAAEGWNPGLSDARIFYETDPTGFFVMEADGIMAGCISAVRYDNSFGFLGLYIMKPEYRGRGWGMQLWNRALEYLDGCNVGLDGVVAQQANYRKSGFTFAYNNIRFQYTVDGKEVLSTAVTPLAQIAFEEVVAFDNQLFPANRSGFLQSWISQPDSIGFGLKEEDRVTGYIIVRKCLEGYKTGPLFAADAAGAEQLLLSAAAQLERGSVIYLDVPQPNQPAMTLVERYGMVKVFETARMYNKSAPNIDLDRVFGVTTFELG